jgi:hypothetical protein
MSGTAHSFAQEKDKSLFTFFRFDAVTFLVISFVVVGFLLAFGLRRMTFWPTTCLFVGSLSFHSFPGYFVLVSRCFFLFFCFCFFYTAI